MPQAWSAGALVFWALVVAGSDIRQRRVPNSFLLPVFIVAAVIQLTEGHGILGTSATDALFGMTVGAVLPFSGYLMRQLGAGDVKYAAVIGLLCGLAGILHIILWSALAMGLISTAAWAWSRWREPLARRLPAAVAISAGFVAHLILSGSFGGI